MFFNNAFNAYNVAEIDFDGRCLAELRQLLISVGFPEKENFCRTSPNWSSDICWISPNTLQGYRSFKKIFDKMRIGDRMLHYLDIRKHVMLYSGFIVTRSRCTAPNFHLDWIETNGQAYTFLCPLTSVPSDFGLLYQDVAGVTREYAYKDNSGLIIGDHFLHSTRPGETAAPASILSFTFGTDKMEYWPSISKTVSSQGNLYRRPDGSFVVMDMN